MQARGFTNRSGKQRLCRLVPDRGGPEGPHYIAWEGRGFPVDFGEKFPASGKIPHRPAAKDRGKGRHAFGTWLAPPSAADLRMKLAALALDYDGTIAVDGTLNPLVRQAISDVRQAGIAVILVTGRRLPDLRRAVGDLACFDVVVAENGAVLEFPSSGRHVQLSHAPAAQVLDALKQRGVKVLPGESVIEADAAAAPTMLEVIRSLEQPLTLSFNRNRLMVLPQAVAKSTGLRQALFALRLSIHNTVAIGDAENDHDLLDACEVGVAVGWGSPALRAVADEVIPGTGPDAVAEYIRRLTKQPRLSTAQMGRRKLLVGHQHDGTPVNLAVRGRTIVIAGEPGTGKSWLAGLLCEQLILQGYCLCLIDPEGDYRSLEALPNVILLGGDDPVPQARDLVRTLRHPDVSVVVDLSKLSHEDKRRYAQHMLPTLAALRRRTGLPHKILVDEAHYFVGGSYGRTEIDSELAGYILVTYRISALDRALYSGRDVVVIVTRESDQAEVKALQAVCSACTLKPVSPQTFDLAMNEAALLPGAEEAAGEIRRFRVAPRLTAHVRHQTKYLDMPVTDNQAFVFWVGDAPGPRAATLKTFTGLLLALPNEAISGHLRRHDFSRWINDVFRDGNLATRLFGLETRLSTDKPHTVAESIAQTIRARYETAGDSHVAHVM
jgi:hydroxymethylpyrimidine pyrophosphatase-like HAD family hydrolase